MPISRSDETDLVIAIHEGVQETPPWATFLARLRRRLRADRALILIGAAGRVTHSFQANRPGGEAAPVDRDDEALLARLRIGRIYSLAELSEDAVRRPQPQPAVPALTDGLFFRVAEPKGLGMCVILLRTQGGFASADGALLTNLIPHLSIALANLAALDRALLRGAIGEAVLHRAGLAWYADDGSAPPPGWPTREEPGEVLRLDGPDWQPAVLIPPATIAVRRTAVPPNHRRTALVGAAFGLTRSEARLAEALADGHSLSQAARVLGVTLETARNYSKRIYAKTGARGQADLVRRVIGSIAWLG